MTPKSKGSPKVRLKGQSIVGFFHLLCNVCARLCFWKFVTFLVFNFKLKQSYSCFLFLFPVLIALGYGGRGYGCWAGRGYGCRG
jgi:hypothetical protein